MRAHVAQFPQELLLKKVLERARRQSLNAYQRGGQQRLRVSRSCRGFERALAAQHGERRLGDESSIVLPEIAVAAEIARQQLIRWRIEAQHPGKRGPGVRQDPAREPHWEMRVTTCSKRVPSFSTTTMRTGR